MTLAWIGLFGVILSIPLEVPAARLPQASQNQNSIPAATQDQQSSTPQTQTPEQNRVNSAAPAQATSNAKPQASKKKQKKASSAKSNCLPDSPKSPSGQKTTSATGSSGSADCPPKKTIVSHGGTSEPSIQLAGGDQASQQKDSTNQILQSTEENLKKITGKQLTPDQQNMADQARQFITQSKSAEATGDLDRAHNLAWKAQVLAQELVKPPEQ